MLDWPAVRFHELAADEKSAFSKPYGSAFTKEDYVPQGVPVVRGVNLNKGIFVDDEFVFINDETADRIPGANLTAGDLIFTHRGTVGQVSMIPRQHRYPRYVLSTSQVKARLDPTRAVPEFYYYWFSTADGQHELLRNVSTVGVPGLGQPVATIKSLTVPHPPLSVQRSITDVLEALDHKIAMNDRIAASTRELAQTHFEAAIRAREPEEHTISSIVEFLSRGVRPRYTDDPAQLMVLNQKCIRAGRVQFDPARRTTGDGVAAQKLLRIGDILVNSTGFGTLGRVACWTFGPQSTVDSHVTIVRFDPARVEPVCAGFAMLAAQREIEALGEGSTGQTELNSTRLGAVRLTLPNRKLVAGLRSKLDALEGKGGAAMRESAALAELRDTLLPRLVSGEIRVRTAEDMLEEVT